MSILSIKFIIFAASLVLLYFIVPKRFQWVVLLLASVLFYISAGLRGCEFILVTIVSQYILAMLLERKNARMQGELDAEKLDGKKKKEIKKAYASRKKVLVFLAVLINLGLMCFFKYANPAIESYNQIFGASAKRLDLLVPIGLSYYTFKSIGYVIDVYRGRVKAQKNILKLALYIGYFPALIQGPIDRYEDLAEQLWTEHRFEYKRFCFGAQRMLWGYMKKLILAERAAVIVSTVTTSYAARGYEGFLLFFGVLMYTFQLYADFSGGMDIVIGLSEIFGISMTENFKRPFFATSLSEYWKRWHITLGAWMRTYVFYPLSLSPAFNKMGKKFRKIFGDRIGKLMAPSLASFVSFVCIGLWHGVGWKYVLYGVYLATFVASGSLLEGFYEKCRHFFKIQDDSKTWHVFQCLRTTFLMTITKYIVCANDVPEIGRMLKATFTHFNPWVLVDGTMYTLGLDRPNFCLLIASIVVLFCVDLVQERGIRIRETIAKKNIVLRWAIYYGAIFALLIFGMYGPGYDAASFIYQRF